VFIVDNDETLMSNTTQSVLSTKIRTSSHPNILFLSLFLVLGIYIVDYN